MLLIGSRALKIAGEQYLSSAQRSWDYDFIVSYDDFLKSKSHLKQITRTYPVSQGRTIVVKTKESGIYEFEIAWEESSAEELLKIIKEDSSLADKDGNWYIAKPNLIFTLKKSHRYLKNSPHFLKTMLDYNHLLAQGCVVPDSLKSWSKKREKETYWYKHPSLDQSKDDFFKDDGIKYIYDHDSIHLSVARMEKPAYEFYKEPGQEVQCSKELFFSVSEEIRLNGVFEEAATLALERSQIFWPGGWSPKKSFEFALMKVCTSITSGWFREYAYNNYFKVIDLYNIFNTNTENYVTKFWNDVELGLVKKL